ncbi:SchA/CurD-like domain-containing protein [Streptomyces radiopugnans]|uniref:Antibiotic biosynthesis monooxygenase n=1 Tax=Streptomyces radiopugnans TaxID=403935 RepID=A0A1H9DIZ6_9ACTN|nr:SchA/CurD-like domain-containing protein [Streptomyces radiopugnans]SEQ13409.1 Antibiotic biosynthesis monooxygenase [Streptomyces radiopugnans]
MTAPAPTTQASGRVSQSAFDGSRLRVILLLDIHDGAQQEFLDAYEHMRNQVASVPGHLSDQLCQSIENPSQWLITSEWESAPPFLAWVNSEEHLETVRPLHSCVRDTRSLRFSVLRETFGGGAGAAAPAGNGLQSAPRLGDGVVRHALTFTVRPGSESKVAEILAGYESPEARVDDTTRLCRTSLFMHGNRVVRAIEVRGDLLAALRHVARQPEVRAVEEALNPHLEQDRDLDDPQSARAFFTRAALPAVHHVASCGPRSPRVRRHALYYPARPGRGMDLARLLSRQDEIAAGDPHGPVRAATVFQRDDVVVRLVEVEGEPDAAPARVLGLEEPGSAAEAAPLLDTEALGLDGPPAGERDLLRLLSHTGMRLVTDRTAPGS